MKKNYIIYILIILLAAIIGDTTNASKQKTPQLINTDSTMKKTENATTHKKLNYKIKKQVYMDLSLYLFNGKPLSNVKIEVLTNTPGRDGKIIATTVSDATGGYPLTISIPSEMKKLYVTYSYSGLIDGTWLEINDNGAIDISIYVDPLIETSGTITSGIMDRFV